MTAAARRPGNPYIAGSSLGGSPAFIGRADVLRDVYSVLRDPQYQGLVLFGQRRIGKTSILQHLLALLPERGPFRPVYFDLQDKASMPLAEVLAVLADVIAETLRLPAPVPGGQVEIWFRGVWMPSVLAQLPTDASVVILFDEFDVLADPRKEQAASALFPYLRQLLDLFKGRLRFVFVIGRNIDDLATIAKELFRKLPERQVSLLAREDADLLIEMSHENATLQWEMGAKEVAWKLTSGHPFLLQNLCWHVWHQLHPEGEAALPRSVTAEQVTAAVPRSLVSAKNPLEWLWDGLPPAGRVVASALAGAGDRAISDDELQELLHESGARIVIRELRDAPRLLEGWDLIEPVQGGYRFRVELLRQWIAKNKPLSRVQKDLDRVQPRAETYYAAAEAEYEEGNPDAAMDLLRKALGANPNHLRATELLAEILISKQEWAEARRFLEQLAENNPGAARGRLVQVLLAQSDAATGEDERLALLDRVLAIQKHPAADAARRKIWREKGDRARAEGRIEEAIAAYRESGDVQREKQLIHNLRRAEMRASLNEVAEMELRGEYAGAHEQLRRLAEKFGDLREWGPDLSRLEAAAQLETIHRQAIQAASSGDRDGAVRALLEVIARNPRYKNATEKLHALVTGVDAHALSIALDEEKLLRLAGVANDRASLDAANGSIAKLKQELDASSKSREGLLRRALDAEGAFLRLEVLSGREREVTSSLRDQLRVANEEAGRLRGTVAAQVTGHVALSVAVKKERAAVAEAQNAAEAQGARAAAAEADKAAAVQAAREAALSARASEARILKSAAETEAAVRAAAAKSILAEEEKTAQAQAETAAWIDAARTARAEVARMSRVEAEKAALLKATLAAEIEAERAARVEAEERSKKAEWQIRFESTRADLLASAEGILRSSRSRVGLALGAMIAILVATSIVLFGYQRSAELELASRTKSLEDLQRRSSLLTTEGPLGVDDVAITASVVRSSGAECVVLENGVREFPATQTCYVYFKLSLVNNAARLAPLNGTLCVKYLRPDGSLDTGTTPYTGPEGPCTIGVPINVVGPDGTVVVPLDRATFEINKGWGRPDGESYRRSKGENHIEFWWQKKKIGETTFQIVDPSGK